jgi:hypothetical protein
LKKLFTRHASPEGVQQIIERLQNQVLQFQEKEREIESEKQKFKYGIGNFLDHEYLSVILEYVLAQRIDKITLVTTVEPFVEKEEDSSEDNFPVAGIWYGVKVMSEDIEIAKILSLLDYDSCFVSEIATKRRRKNLFLATKIAEYIKVSLESERMIDIILKEVELKEEILVGKALFHPEDKEKVIGFKMNLNQE